MTKAQANGAGLYEAQVDGQRYEFSKWGAEDALDTLFDLGVLMGKPLTELLQRLPVGTFQQGAAMLHGILTAEMGEGGLGALVRGVTEGLASNRGVALRALKNLASNNVMCEGVRVGFDTHYRGRLPHMMKVAWAGLEVQYGDFFAALPVPAERAAPQPSPPAPQVS